jgi:hypothetical protein
MRRLNRAVTGWTIVPLWCGDRPHDRHRPVAQLSPPSILTSLPPSVSVQVPRYDEHHRPVTSLSSLAIGRGAAGELPDARTRARLERQMGDSPAYGGEAVRWCLAASHQCALTVSRNTLPQPAMPKLL